MRTRNAGGSSTLQLDSEEEERAVNVVSVTAEETLREVRQTVAQQLSHSGNKESEACRVIEVFDKRYTLLANSKKRVEEEKVKIAVELELRKRAFVNLTLEMEELKEEFKVYKELPSTLKQRQLDNDQLKGELHKLQAEYKKVTDSLVYHTSLKKDLNKEFFHMHKENEGLKHQMELLRIRHHENLQEVRSTRQSAESGMLQEREQQVILITKERDEVQARVEVLSQQVTSQFDRFQTSIWNHELLSPPSFSLFRAYELQHNLLLKVLDFERGCQLDSSNFDRIWRITKG
jgi:predicted  nucleic acid-binding Zn-ribbon protein